LISERELSEGPGPGGPAFAAALRNWNQGQHEQAATEYIKALQAGLTSAYEAASRSNLGQIFLKQGKVQEAISQFTKALHASPQIPDTAYDAAARLIIIFEEMGVPDQAQKAREIAQSAQRRMNSSLSGDAADNVRRIVRQYKLSGGTTSTIAAPKAPVTQTVTSPPKKVNPRCSACGLNNYDWVEKCGRCGAPLSTQ